MIVIANDEKNIKAEIEKTWLLYFNKYLLEHNVITEKEYYAMNNKILSSKKAVK